jgi:CRP/FNR family cyclic AMP-dependent transcriptional regulator
MATTSRMWMKPDLYDVATPRSPTPVKRSRLLRACWTSAACYAVVGRLRVPLCTRVSWPSAYSRRMVKRIRSFSAQAFLDSAGLSKQIVEYGRAQAIFSQGDPSESVMYIQQGGVKLSVLSKTGREAVVAMLGPGEFFGEGCLAGQPVRIGSATAITPSTVLVIDKKQMIKVLHQQHALSDRFIAHMLSRNVRIEQDLIDQLFNSSEKRLARALLLLARYGKQGKPRHVLAKISQETLSEMVGTTRSRVNFFMNKFRRLGFIEYNNGNVNAGVQINSSLLSVVLHD